MNKLCVSNISNKEGIIIDNIYNEINNLNEKIIKIINNKKLKIIIANKISDVINFDNKGYDYKSPNIDKTIRGLVSDDIMAIALFTDVIKVSRSGIA